MASNTSKIYYLDKSSNVTTRDKAVFVKKVIHDKYKKYDFVNREVHWLKKLELFDRTPKIISFNSNSMIMTYMGNPIQKNTIPTDWKEQIKYIVDSLKSFIVSHNDIQSEEILVLGKKINLIDFQHATNTREEFEELRRQGKTTVGSWIKDDYISLLSEITEILKK
jgi:predicted Ser/Thr protein kinase